MATTLLNYPATSFSGDYNAVIVTGDLAAYHDVKYGRAVVVFADDNADEHVAITHAVVMPQAYASGTLTAKLYYFTGATSGNISMEVYVEAVTDADTVDLDSASSFDTVNPGSPVATAVPATAGYLDVLSITLTNKDSVAAGDYVRFAVRRDSDDTTNDTAGGDVYLVAMEIQEA